MKKFFEGFEKKAFTAFGMSFGGGSSKGAQAAAAKAKAGTNSTASGGVTTRNTGAAAMRGAFGG